MDRMHYGGPVWEGKKPNPSIMEELADPKTRFSGGKPEVNPVLKKPKQPDFEEVKR